MRSSACTRKTDKIQREKTYMCGIELITYSLEDSKARNASGAKRLIGVSLSAGAWQPRVQAPVGVACVRSVIRTFTEGRRAVYIFPLGMTVLVY